MIGNFLTYLGVGLLWLLGQLPYTWCAHFGEGLGHLLFWIPSRRKEVVLVNLRLCFPEKTELERYNLAREHFVWLMRSFAERGFLWFASTNRIRRKIRFVSEVEWKVNKPRIFLGMHFVGIEGGTMGFSLIARDEVRDGGATLYTPMSNKIIERVSTRGRERFGAKMIPRTDNARELIRMIRGGTVLQLSPDMDFGVRDSEFLPFFGVQACTLTSISRLARLSGALVYPVVYEMLPNYEGYLIRILPPWENYPGESVTADTLRMNQEIESHILRQPAQYYWVHKRFKTRPEGEPSVY